MMIKHKQVSLKALEYVGISRRMFLVEAFFRVDPHGRRRRRRRRRRLAERSVTL